PFAAVVLLVHPLAAPPADGATLPPGSIDTITALARWAAFAVVLEWLRVRYSRPPGVAVVEAQSAHASAD
ncbi:MAG: hypothetical protein O2822_04585, partial [Chloroflexi bacterium]|nr:hypothetical protein [Chloroflexota bacterium]